eukprot:scaffold13_cov241-Pinguiococcus_pyrenoidosus.AAC.6
MSSGPNFAPEYAYSTRELARRGQEDSEVRAGSSGGAQLCPPLSQRGQLGCSVSRGRISPPRAFSLRPRGSGPRQSGAADACGPTWVAHRFVSVASPKRWLSRLRRTAKRRAAKRRRRPRKGYTRR